MLKTDQTCSYGVILVGIPRAVNVNGTFCTLQTYRPLEREIILFSNPFLPVQKFQLTLWYRNLSPSRRSMSLIINIHQFHWGFQNSKTFRTVIRRTKLAAFERSCLRKFNCFRWMPYWKTSNLQLKRSMSLIYRD